MSTGFGHIVNGDFSYGKSIMNDSSYINNTFFHFLIPTDASDNLWCRIGARNGGNKKYLQLANTPGADFGWYSTQTETVSTDEKTIGDLTTVEVQPDFSEVEAGTGNTRGENANFYSEIVAEQTGCAIYQDVSTPVAGAILKWRLKHASIGKNANSEDNLPTNIDQMSVAIGETEAVKKQERI